MLRRKRGLFSSPSEKIISKNTNPTFQEVGGVTRPLITICPAHRVYLLDLFCSGIQFYLLLSLYLCFISLLYLDLYVLGDDTLIS